MTTTPIARLLLLLPALSLFTGCTVTHYVQEPMDKTLVAEIGEKSTQKSATVQSRSGQHWADARDIRVTRDSILWLSGAGMPEHLETSELHSIRFTGENRGQSAGAGALIGLVVGTAGGFLLSLAAVEGEEYEELLRLTYAAAGGMVGSVIMAASGAATGGETIYRFEDAPVPTTGPPRKE